MNGELAPVTAGAVAMLLMEGIKWAVRQWWKGPNYDFPVIFYVVGLPVLGYLVGPGLAWLGVTDYVIPTDWIAWVRDGVLILISALISYVAGIQPLKEYGRSLRRNG